MTSVRYGILSTAQIARNRHLPAAREVGCADVVAIASRDLDRARAVATEFGIDRAYGSYQELLDDADIDAVINPLPNSMHCEWTIKAAEAGKHVLCEKPLAVTVDEAQRMIDAAKSNNVILTEGFTHRLNPQLRYARQAVATGEIGPVKLLRAELTYKIQDWENDARVKKELAGGALLDAGCYCVSALRFVLGAEPEFVQAVQRLHDDQDVDATFSGLLRFPDDCIGYIATGMEQTFRCVCEIVGLDGRIVIDNMFNESQDVRVLSGGSERIDSYTAPGRFAVQLESFSACIIESRPPEFAPEDGLLNTRVLVALRKAAAERREIPV